ncbi:hypothetical protein FPHYL_2615 [Fusarium phyllophilum]|uniref:Uncharacterized protein n=1 Tax=Fusarium phyllophilum TaxID=47803 RepID=A0A8H5NL81_9HYPO|nr:hypothetical protein FPHYL_2615 [Fusarium phyllophilum]
MDISFGPDRLAAVSGVAKQISQATRSGYAAGLWVDEIHKDLIFERNLHARNNRDKGGLEKYTQSLRDRHLAIGPTWSWPGHRGGRPKLESECKQLDITTNKDGENLFGQVSRGTLTVTAKMTSVADIAALHDGDDVELIKKVPSSPEYGPQDACGIKWNWDVDNAGTPSHFADEILVIALSSYLYARSDIRNMWGLMVYPAEKLGEYYRIGSFQAEAAGKGEEGEGTGLLMAEEWKGRSIVII